MGSKIALPIAVLMIGTAFATVSAFAQQQPQSPQSQNQKDEYLQSASGSPSASAPRANQSPGFVDVWNHRSTYDYVPGQYYNYYPGPGPITGGTAWCEAHYRTYNPATGMYRGFDGVMHACP